MGTSWVGTFPCGNFSGGNFSGILFKHPIRDACLYLGEWGEKMGPPAPPASSFSIAYSLATTGCILFKFSTCMQQPWEKFLNMVS